MTLIGYYLLTIVIPVISGILIMTLDIYLLFEIRDWVRR